jgi:hypothetical protein
MPTDEALTAALLMRQDRITVGALEHYTVANTRTGPWIIAAAILVDEGDVVTYHGRGYRITRIERRGVLLEVHGEALHVGR